MRPRGTGGKKGWKRADDKTPRGRRNAGQKLEKKGRAALRNSKRFGK